MTPFAILHSNGQDCLVSAREVYGRSAYHLFAQKRPFMATVMTSWFSVLGEIRQMRRSTAFFSSDSSRQR